ncbi:hypothetical protein DFP92_1413 [Yoonia sediminilitoris]|uniref:Uncharacterized protein n=1 Tax=Yoonia sediminilitoris TaxID=1286148 RepID=A0A2T6K0W5_9RHOB|nr:hypothetical protein C8N45_1423 [Yoonia sediminilitoris]RCW89412.1 hypothetical protein DFP92_1413 [Yoonia sediminilitoris]
MTEYPFIPSIADRLAQPNRSNPFVRSEPGSRVKGANRQQPGVNPRQTLRWKVKTTVFNPHTNASAAASDPTGSTLFP